MKHIFTGFNLIGAIALLALGCAANTQQTENLLSAAGFRTVIANTPQRQQHLKTLPPNKVTLVQRNGKNYYVYADPAHWQIFVGNPSQSTAPTLFFAPFRDTIENEYEKSNSLSRDIRLTSSCHLWRRTGRIFDASESRWA
jgi:hypothetical protein